MKTKKADHTTVCFLLYTNQSMYTPKFSILNPFAETRVENVRNEIKRLLSFKKLDEIIVADLSVTERKDKYFAAMAVLLKNLYFNFENKILADQPKIIWSGQDSFKEIFLETYVQLISEYCSDYFRSIMQDVSVKLAKLSENQEVILSEDEKAYLAFCYYDENPNGGLTVLSPLDGLFIMTHVFELGIKLGLKNYDELNKFMNSAGVRIFVNSLMINESGDMGSLMSVLSSDPNKRNHKKNDFTFDESFFTLSSEYSLVVRNDILSLFRKLHGSRQKESSKLHRRNCPASYTPKETNQFLRFLSEQILFQYEDFESNTKV